MTNTCDLIQHGIVKSTMEKLFEAPINITLRGHCFKVGHKMPHFTHRTLAFSVHGTRFVDAASDENFKTRLPGIWYNLYGAITACDYYVVCWRASA